MVSTCRLLPPGTRRAITLHVRQKWLLGVLGGARTEGRLVCFQGPEFPSAVAALQRLGSRQVPLAVVGGGVGGDCAPKTSNYRYSDTKYFVLLQLTKIRMKHSQVCRSLDFHTLTLIKGQNLLVDRTWRLSSFIPIHPFLASRTEAETN